MVTFRYLLSAYARRVALTLVATVALLIVGDFAELASSILARSDAAALTLVLYRSKLPNLTLAALPLATLLGLLLTLAGLMRHRELLALRVAGLSSWRLARPGIALALALSLAGLGLAREVAPRGMRRAVEIETGVLGRWTWTWTLFHKPRTLVRGPGGEIYEVDAVREGGRRLLGVRRYDVRDGRLVRLARARTLRFERGRWRAEAPRVWTFDPAHPERVRLERGPFPDLPPPAHFQGVPGQPSELTLAELDRALAIRKAQARPRIALRLERHDRLARPLLTLALALLALGLGLGVRTPESAAEAAAWAVVVATVGWTTLAVFRAMGLAGMLPVPAAAWCPVALPALAGGLLLALRSAR